MKLKPQDSFGEFNNSFSLSSESAGNHQKHHQTFQQLFGMMIVMQYCPVAKYHYVHNLWQSVRGDTENFYVLVIS